MGNVGLCEFSLLFLKRDKCGSKLIGLCVHKVNAKLLDPFFFMAMDSTFNVRREFLQV